MEELRPGRQGRATQAVTDALTAQALGSGTVPVFATPALLALMEQAAVDAVAPALAAGSTTVGIYAELHHSAATPVGQMVTAEATLTAVDGRTLTFEITARDEVEPIGHAVHRRVVVDEGRFVQRAAGKAAYGRAAGG